MASDNELLIRLGVDTSNADKQLKAIQNELRELNKQIKLVDDSTDDYNKSAEGLAKQLQLQEKAAEAYSTQLKTQQKQLNQYKQALSEYQTKLKQLNEAEGDHSDEIKKTEQAIEGYRQKIAKLETSMDTTVEQMRAMNRSIEDTNKQLNGLKWNNLAEGLENVSKGFKGVSDVADRIGDVFAPVSAALTAGFGYAIKTSVDFERAMTQVGVTSQATAEELEQLSAVAIELGEELPISATDAANGLNYLALAGYDVAQQLVAIEPIAKASVAWNEDLATVSDMATDSLSAMNLGVEDLGRYLDMASNAQSNANTTALALMEAYIEVGASLTQLNVPLEESMSLLGVMANRGIKGGEAGRALNAVLINLTSGTARSKQALEELNIEMFDAEGKFRGLEVILKELNEALADCTEEERNNFLAMIGGKQHVGDLNALLNGLNEEYGDLKNTISDSTGVLDEMTEKMGSTTAMTIEELKGKLESLAIEIGNKLLPHIVTIVEHISDWVDKFNRLDTETQNNIIQMALFATTISPIAKTISNVTDTISDLTGGLGNLAKWLGEKGGIIGLLGKLGAQTQAGTTVSTLGEAVSGAMSGGAMAGLAAVLAPIAIGLGSVAAVGGGVWWLCSWLSQTGQASPSAIQGLLGMNEATRLLLDTVEGMDGTYENTANAIVNFSDIASSTWADMVHSNNALTQEQYNVISAATEATHNTIMTELEKRRNNVPEIVRALYAEELRLADQKGEEAVRLVEEEIQAEIELRQGRVDQEIAAEEERFSRLSETQQRGLEDRYAQNETFQQNSLLQHQAYYNEANRIFETGEQINAQTVMDNQKGLAQNINDFANQRTERNLQTYNQLVADTNTGEAEALAAALNGHEQRLAAIDSYTDQELTMMGTSKAELRQLELEAYEAEKADIEAHFDTLRGVLDEGWNQQQAIEKGHYELRQEVTRQGLTLSEAEYEHFNQRIQSIMEQNGMDDIAAVQTVMDEIALYRRTGYLKQEEDLVTHNANMTTATEQGMIEVKDATHRGIGGAIELVEASDFGTPMANNMTEMEIAAQNSQFTHPIQEDINNAVWVVESADFYNAGKTALGGFNNAINEIIPQSKESLQQNVTDAIWIVESADFYNPANASYGKVPQAADEKLSEANEKSTGWLETIANSINVWDLLTPTLTAGQGLIDGMTQTMTDTNTEAETGVETINTTIEDAPFEDTMNTQGEKMNNSMQDAMETINTTTENGMETIDTTIDNTPLEATMESQGARMNAAQEGNMSDLASTTRSGMSEVRSALETAWNGIVAWWNAQSLRDKDVNINVRTNYSTTGTPTQYSNGSGITPMSLRSNEGFMGSFFPSNMEIPERGLISNPYPYDMRGVTASIGKLDLPDLNYLSRRSEPTQSYDLSSLDKKLDTLIEVLSHKENGNTTFTIEEMNVRTDQDIRNIARELDALRKIQARGRGES